MNRLTTCDPMLVHCLLVLPEATFPTHGGTVEIPDSGLKPADVEKRPFSGRRSGQPGIRADGRHGSCLKAVLPASVQRPSVQTVL